MSNPTLPPAVDTRPSYGQLVGDPPTPKDAATTALVTPEVLAGFLAELAAQEVPVETAVPLAEAFFREFDRYFRQKVGPLPWVLNIREGTVLAITGQTCTVRCAGIDQPVTGVLYGRSKPAVGDRYPVRFPVALPPEGVSLFPGPVPSGQPWIKVAGGETWLYYFGDSASGQTTLWRVPLPGPAPFTYPAEAAQEVHLLPGRPTVPNAGDLRLAGPGLVTHTLYLEESAFERFSRPELAPTTYPYPLRIHRYPEFGATGEEAPYGISTQPLTHLRGTNLSVGTEHDVLLGERRYSVEQVNPTPFPASHYYYQQADLALSLDGGGTWDAKRSGVVLTKQVFIFYPPSSSYVDAGRVKGESTIYNAAGWVADADISELCQAGDRVDTWMLDYWVEGNPYPGDRVPVPLVDDLPTQYRMNWWPQKHTLGQLWVSRNGGAAVPFNFPQPPGWMTQCFLRPSGGGGLRAWWQGHAQQFVIKTPLGGTPPVFFIEYAASDEALWVGEKPATSNWQWRPVATPPGANRIVHCNGDGSVALAARFSGNDVVRDIDSHWLTQDAGETWQELPLPPHFPWDPAHYVSYIMRGWLIDLP